MTISWTRNDNQGFVAYEAERPDGTYMSVVESINSTDNFPLWDIFVEAHDGESEFFLGEMGDTDVNSCIERAESVRLPEEDTGI